MIRAIFLDSSPLGLITQRVGIREADQCNTWLAGHLDRGVAVLVPEIIDCEIAARIDRAGKTDSLKRLDSFNSANRDRYVTLTTRAMRLAAQLWSDIRKRVIPTADPHELDVDVILAAQALSHGIPVDEIVIATSNPAFVALHGATLVEHLTPSESPA